MSLHVVPSSEGSNDRAERQHGLVSIYAALSRLLDKQEVTLQESIDSHPAGNDSYRSTAVGGAVIAVVKPDLPDSTDA